MWLEYLLVGALAIWFVMGVIDYCNRRKTPKANGPGKLKITVQEIEQ